MLCNLVLVLDLSAYAALAASTRDRIAHRACRLLDHLHIWVRRPQDAAPTPVDVLEDRMTLNHVFDRATLVVEERLRIC